MLYRVIELQLTDEQLAAIQAITDDDERQFALLAHPQARGVLCGAMPVYILTREQSELLDPAIKAARALPAF